MRRLIAWLIAFALSASPVFARERAVPAPAAPSAPSAPEGAAKPALWVVRDKDTTIYLFGTVHVLRPELQWFGGAVKTAYDSASEVRLELISPDPATMQELIVKLALDPGGKPLSEKLGPVTAEAWRKALATIDLNPAGMEALKPWFAATVVSLLSIKKAGYDPESGVEKALTGAARRDGKALSGFETPEEQMGFFNGFSETQQIDFLKSTIDELPKERSVLDAIVADWAKGDPDGLSALLNASLSTTPDLGRVLLLDRNKRWAAWIANRMAQPGTLFIAVGAGHLAGKGSVQDALKSLKLKAKRVPS